MAERSRRVGRSHRVPLLVAVDDVLRLPAWLHDLLQPHVPHIAVCNPRRDARLPFLRTRSKPALVRSLILIRSCCATAARIPMIASPNTPRLSTYCSVNDL